MDKELEFEYDLANLALKGKRFKESENKYLDIARKSGSSLAWCGVGLSKLGLIIDNESTVDEVFYCFDKAKAVDSSTIGDIENFVLQNCFQVIKTLYGYLIQAHNLQEEAKKQKVMGIITVVASSFIGLSTSNNRHTLYSDLTALGGTAIGYNNYANGKLRQLEASELKTKITSLITETEASTIAFIENEKDKLQDFTKAVNSLSSQISATINSDNAQLSENKKAIYLKNCQIIEEHKFDLSKAELFKKVVARITSIGTLLREDYLEGYIEAKIKYWGLNTSWLKIYIQETAENRCHLSIGANSQDVLSIGSKKAIQKFNSGFTYS